MRRYRQSKTDRNHAEVMQAYRRFGATVCDLSPMGGGVPDLLVAHTWCGLRRSFVAEVKDPEQPPNKRKLNPGEALWATHWRGEYWVVETLDDVVRSLAGPADPEAAARAAEAQVALVAMRRVRAAADRRERPLQFGLFDAELA
jgi:hypothetical protein